MIPFTFSFGCVKLGHQSSPVLTVFCIWIICIRSQDTQRSQSLETTVAPNLNYKIDKNNPRDIMARFFSLSQKLAPTRKIVPTDQHYQHVFLVGGNFWGRQKNRAMMSLGLFCLFCTLNLAQQLSPNFDYAEYPCFKYK